MASDGGCSDSIPYDDDFEAASDDDGGTHKSLQGVLHREVSSASRRRKEGAASAPTQVSDPYMTSGAGQPPVMEGSSSRPGRRRQVEDPKAGVTSAPRPSSGRRQVEKTEVKTVTAEEAALDMNISQTSFGASGGRRPVRAKISVSNENELSGRRPGSQGSGAGTNESTAKPSSARPIWLQNDESRPLARHVSPSQGDPARGFGAQGDFRATAGDCVSASSVTPPRYAGRARPPVDPHFDLEGQASARTADDGDRKLKRLQQEIQRLTARLTEAELYSSQDEGLPLFTLEEVDIGCQIGQGGFCQVFTANWRSTPCAIKKIFDPVITDELKAEFENEVRMLRRLRHPNIIIIMAVCRVPPALSILTEFVAGGSLFELLHGPPQSKRRDSIDCVPANLLPVMHQLSGALAYLHAMLIAHRDVKSHNVLLTPGRFPVAKLCDFGLARPKSELCTGTMQWAGTACYMAPELFAKRKYTEAVDVFAFGVMLWEVMSTEIPHANMDPCDIAHRVQSKDGAGLPVQHGWPKSLKALLKTLMAVQQEERPSMISVGEQLQQIILEFPAPDSY